MHGAAAWLTVNVWPPMASVPVRGPSPYWPRRCNGTEPLPSRSSHAVNVIHPALGLPTKCSPRPRRRPRGPTCRPRRPTGSPARAVGARRRRLGHRERLAPDRQPFRCAPCSYWPRRCNGTEPLPLPLAPAGDRDPRRAPSPTTCSPPPRSRHRTRAGRGGPTGSPARAVAARRRRLGHRERLAADGQRAGARRVPYWPRRCNVVDPLPLPLAPGQRDRSHAARRRRPRAARARGQRPPNRVPAAAADRLHRRDAYTCTAPPPV